MELNRDLVELFELMDYPDLSDQAVHRKLRTRYRRVTDSLTPAENKLFNRLFKQFLNLKLDRLHSRLDALGKDLDIALREDGKNTRKSSSAAKGRRKSRRPSPRRSSLAVRESRPRLRKP